MIGPVRHILGCGVHSGQVTLPHKADQTLDPVYLSPVMGSISKSAERGPAFDFNRFPASQVAALIARDDRIAGSIDHAASIIVELMEA
jgi:hypothetical protein